MEIRSRSDLSEAAFDSILVVLDGAIWQLGTPAQRLPSTARFRL